MLIEGCHASLKVTIRLPWQQISGFLLVHVIQLSKIIPLTTSGLLWNPNVWRTTQSRDICLVASLWGLTSLADIIQLSRKISPDLDNVAM